MPYFVDTVLPLHQRQEISLHAFPGHVDGSGFGTPRHLVYLVDEHDAVLLDVRAGLRPLSPSSSIILPASSSPRSDSADLTGIFRVRVFPPDMF